MKPGDLSGKAEQVVEEPEVKRGSSGTSGAGGSRDVGGASGENRNNRAGRISGRTGHPGSYQGQVEGKRVWTWGLGWGLGSP